MTPKEKAKELVKKYSDLIINAYDKEEGMHEIPLEENENESACKEAALICIEEIQAINVRQTNIFHLYWQKVKQEIEKL